VDTATVDKEMTEQEVIDALDAVSPVHPEQARSQPT
jgi:hypothetical protein